MLSPRRAPAFINSIDAVIVFDFIYAESDIWIPGSELGERFPLELFGDEAIDGTVEGEHGRFRDRLEMMGSSDIMRGFGSRR